jgi:hypothetical protein
MPAHTIAGGFSTLVALVPWKLAEAWGLSEDVSALLGGGSLALLGLAAFRLRKVPWVQRRSFPLTALHGEVFSLSHYFLDFASFALLMLIMFGGIWIALSYALQT